MLTLRNFNHPPIIPKFTGGNRGEKAAEGLIKAFEKWKQN